MRQVYQTVQQFLIHGKKQTIGTEKKGISYRHFIFFQKHKVSLNKNKSQVIYLHKKIPKKNK